MVVTSIFARLWGVDTVSKVVRRQVGRRFEVAIRDGMLTAHIPGDVFELTSSGRRTHHAETMVVSSDDESPSAPSDNNGDGTKFSPDSNIGDLLAEHGDAAPAILGKYGLHCVGCHLARGETLAAGARMHGLSDEQLDALVAELNEELG